MKEKIRLALVNRYKNLGFSDKAIDGILAYLEASVTADDQIDAAVTAVEGMLKAFQSEIDGRVNTAVAKAKEKPADPAPAPTPAPAPVPDDTPAWAKALIDQNKALADKIQAIEQGKSADTRKSQLEAALKDAPDAYKNTIMKAFARMNFENEESFTGYLDEVKADLPAVIQTEANAGLSRFPRPAQPKGDASKTASKEELDAVMSNIM